MALLNISKYSSIARGTGGLTAPSTPKVKKSSVINLASFKPTIEMTYIPNTPTVTPVLPRNALQGAMAASQSLQTKAYKDYVAEQNPSFWNLKQRSINEGNRRQAVAAQMEAQYANEPKSAPYIDLMDSLSERFSGGTWTPSATLAQAAVKYVGTVAKLAIGAWFIGLQAATAISAVVGVTQMAKANNLNIRILKEGESLKTLDQDLATKGIPGRIAVDADAVMKLNEAGKKMLEMNDPMLISTDVSGKIISYDNEQKFQSYVDMLQAGWNMLKTAHVADMVVAAENPNAIAIPAGTFEQVFGNLQGITPYIPPNIAALPGVPQVGAMAISQFIPQMLAAIPMPATQQEIPEFSMPYSASGLVTKAGTTSPAGIPATLGNAVTQEPWQLTRKQFESGLLVNPENSNSIKYEHYPERPDLWLPTTIWYHGTQADFENFKSRGISRGTTDITSRLGIHFSGQRWVAEQFAKGLYGKAASTGRVIEAQLSVNNPKTYQFEGLLRDDMAQYAIDSGLILAKDISEYYYPDKNGKLSVGFSNGIDILKKIKGSDRVKLINGFIKNLKANGYDGIVYGNTVEGSFANKAAIVFDPKQIKQVSGVKPHIQYVVDALREGKPISPEVLADYPGLVMAARKLSGTTSNTLKVGDKYSPTLNGIYTDVAVIRDGEKIPAKTGDIPLTKYDNMKVATITSVTPIEDGTATAVGLRWGKEGANETIVATRIIPGNAAVLPTPEMAGTGEIPVQFEIRKGLSPKELTQYHDTSFMGASNAADYLENGTYGVVSTFTKAPDGSTPEVVAARAAENQALADKYAAITNRHEAIASYGGIEKSFIVPINEVMELGKYFHQQSVMTVKNHHYEIIDIATGKKTMEGSHMEFGNFPDFYTQVVTAQEPLSMSVTDMHDVTDSGMTEADYAAKQGEAQALLKAAANQGIPASPVPAGTTQQGAKDVTVFGFAGKISQANNSTGIGRAFSYSGFSGEYVVHGLANGNSVITTAGTDSIAVTEGFIDAYLNHPENLHITPVRYDLAKNAGAKFTDSHGGLVASGRSITAMQNKLNAGKIVIKFVANATGSESKLASIRNTGIREIWTMYGQNPIFRDAVQKQMPGFFEAHPDLYWQEKGITKEDRLFLNKIAYEMTDDYNLQRAGKISGILILSKNGLFDAAQLHWNPADTSVETYRSIYSGVFHRFNDIASMPDYGQIVAADAVTRGRNPQVYASPFAENIELSISTPEVRTVIDTLARGIEDYRRQVGLTSSSGITNVPQGAANAPQPETSGTIDMSKYKPEVTPEEVVTGINGALRPGSLNIGKVAHLLNTPERIAAQLLRDDPLKYGLDKLGVYDLLYGKGTNAELRVGTGNPSIWNMQVVPATVRNIMLWGPLFTGETRMTFKDISVEADRQREALIWIDRNLSKLTQDEFIDVLWKISRGGSNVPAMPGVTPIVTKTQQIANAYNAATERVSQNLIAAGLDPNIFARLGGHYLPAPFDELGRDVLPSIDEKITVKPSLSFIEKQKSSQQDIIGYASADDTWQDYRDYMISRIAAEIRAGEKGRFFNAIANDPHTNAIDPKSIDYNTGKRVILPKGYVEFSLGGQKSAFALDGLAIPKWAALFIKNEFTSAAAMEQMKGIQELLGQWKWNKAIANIPTAIRNMISQLTAQSLEAGMSVMNLDDYIIRPLGALLGLNKTDKKQLVDLGILDVGLSRELEGLGFSPQERALWMSGKDRGLMLGMVYDKLKTVRNVGSTAYAFFDNLTKAGSFYTALRTYDARTARVISSITTGDYSQRPPMINFLSRGIYNGKVNPLAMIISSPFAFFKTVVEPQRVGNLIRNRPSLFVLYALAAGLVLKGLKKKIVRDYGKSEQEAEALINEFNNYQWLNGRLVIPTGLNEGIDVTPMIPMVNFIVEAKKALVENRGIVEDISTLFKLVSGTDSINFVVEIIGALATGNDLNYFLRYGTVKSIGKTDVERLLWLADQFVPTWISKLFIKKPNGKPFTLPDLLGQYHVVETEADKNKMWYYVRTDPTIGVEEKKRMAAALFGPKSIEQIGWDRIMNH